MDGNGRATHGRSYRSPRNIYMAALEKASVGEDIAAFAEFLAGLVRKGLAGEPLPLVPKG